MKFLVTIVSPDGPFTKEEISEMLWLGYHEKYTKKGQAIRWLYDVEKLDT